METAGIVPDQDIKDEDSAGSEMAEEDSVFDEPSATGGDAEERLSVFENFLENLDIEDDRPDADEDDSDPADNLPFSR